MSTLFGLFCIVLLEFQNGSNANVTISKSGVGNFYRYYMMELPASLIVIMGTF